MSAIIAPIQTFDATSLDIIKTAIIQAVSSIAVDAHLGVKVTGYVGNSFSASITIKLTTDGCDHRTDEEIEFLAQCATHFLAENTLGRELIPQEGSFKDKSITVLGARWRCTKYPIIIGVKVPTKGGTKTKRYRCRVSTIVNALRAAGQLEAPVGSASFKTKRVPSSKTFTET